MIAAGACCCCRSWSCCRSIRTLITLVNFFGLYTDQAVVLLIGVQWLTTIGFHNISPSGGGGFMLWKHGRLFCFTIEGLVIDWVVGPLRFKRELRPWRVGQRWCPFPASPNTVKRNCADHILGWPSPCPLEAWSLIDKHPVDSHGAVCNSSPAV